MMTLPQVETAIYAKIGQFTHPDTTVRIENQPLFNGQQFVPPIDKPWCKVSIQYADSQVASIGDSPCIRDYGMISIQCFTPKSNGTLAMTTLCDQWRKYLQSFGVSHLEVYKVHAPQSMDDQDFYAKIIRAEFRVN